MRYMNTIFKIISDEKLAPIIYNGAEQDAAGLYTEEFVLNNMRDYRNHRFNDKVYQLLNKNLFYMDIGTGWGGVVEDFINDGHMAVGIDGFYVYEKYLPYLWEKYLNTNFFLTNAAKPFHILWNDERVYFDVITSFEFQEHLFENDQDIYIKNVYNNLKKDGYYICGISYSEQGGHVTVRDRAWWIKKFNEHKFNECSELYEYFGNDFVHFLGNSHYLIFKK